ncbi:hypothetical protein TSOC_009623 [Tetrabaena socialis]|uniref:Carbohydrate kinase PfkB domain-containing protein n=1 Tax=Tetrabaena socialis TaxID=47790 RepID=A0A2J7ZVE7_9CHLO|nr:hypothetical protein TSOC_009623 [Tetrabaena socialis]|eukprot:PNH04246.1 hypothetical protein TSOC_009623 [Tetrabaena socialis]
MSMPAPESDACLRVAVIQVSALVDHVASVDKGTLHRLAGLEVAGSKRCGLDELQDILASVGHFESKAGGSASNVGRALATGFGVAVQLVGTRGGDEWGAMYAGAMQRAGVNTERVRVLQGGSTGRSAILTCEGERTMRTFMDPGVTTRAGSLAPSDVAGCSWLFLSAYCLYSEGLLPRAVQLANEAGVKVVLDLASYEVVRTYHEQLLEVLEGGGVHFCVCNETSSDGAQAVAAKTPPHSPPASQSRAHGLAHVRLLAAASSRVPSSASRLRPASTHLEAGGKANKFVNVRYRTSSFDQADS